MSKKEQKLLYKIASKHNDAIRERGDLERRWSDSEDFIELSVWSIEEMLKEVYDLGKASKE